MVSQTQPMLTQVYLKVTWYIDENRPLGRRDNGQRGLQRARRGREKRKEKPSTFRKLDNEDVDYEQNECNYPYIKNRYGDIVC